MIEEKPDKSLEVRSSSINSGITLQKPLLYTNYEDFASIIRQKLHELQNQNMSLMSLIQAYKLGLQQGKSKQTEAQQQQINNSVTSINHTITKISHQLMQLKQLKSDTDMEKNLKM